MKLSSVGISEFSIGDRVIVTTCAPKPRWWQLWRLFSYYILRRRFRKNAYTVSDVVDSCTLELSDGLPENPAELKIELPPE